jgi:hypothetical protein
MAMATRSPQPKRPSAQDLANADQLGQLPLTIAGLTWPDGQPMELLIRARTHEDRARCNRQAIKAALALNDGATFDEDTYAVYAAFYGLAEPRLTEAQLPILWAMNPFVLDEIVDAIERIERLPAHALKAQLELLAGTPIPEKPTPKARTGRTARASELDSRPGPQAEPISGRDSPSP